MPGTIGNKNGKRAKEWRDALNYALSHYENSSIQKNGALRAIAKELITKALDGDMQAIKEMGDRIDGKPAQAIIGEDGGPLQAAITVSFKAVDE